MEDLEDDREEMVCERIGGMSDCKKGLVIEEGGADGEANNANVKGVELDICLSWDLRLVNVASEADIDGKDVYCAKSEDEVVLGKR